MSLAMRQSKMIRRSAFVGDPGLGSFIKKTLGTAVKGAIGFVTGGPIGAVTAIGSSLIPQPKAPPMVPMMPTPQPVQGFGGQFGGTITIPGVGTISGGTGVGITGTPGFGPGTGGAIAAAPGACVPGMPGVRLNKSGYHLRSGQYIAPGTKCVRVRRRNPLNPRALSKAMSRVVSAKKAASALNRISIRSSCAKCK